MPFGGVLFPYRFMALGIGGEERFYIFENVYPKRVFMFGDEIIGFASPPVDEILRHVHVFPVARHFCQFNQSDFHFLVSGYGAAVFFLVKDVAD